MRRKRAGEVCRGGEGQRLVDVYESDPFGLGT